MVVPLVMMAALAGCGLAKRSAGKMPEGWTGELPEVPAHLRSRGPSAAPISRVTLEGGGGTGGAGSGTTAVLPGGLTPDSDIVWTDPDDPDAELPGLEDTLATQKKNRGPWEISHVEAKRLAMRAGKPLLVWFTNSQSSPVCQTLSRELFSTGDFDGWAAEHLVRLRLDFNVRGSGAASDDKMDDRIRKVDYLETLKKRYKVGGYPTVLVMAPDGTVMGRYRGYRKGSPDFYWGRIKSATGLAEDHHGKWVDRMEGRGYREWTDTKGRTVFAKLLRYHRGDMILVEPDGRRLKAQERQLSSADRLWIKGEQAKRAR
ncbi:MAG: thioredoxin family protein [Akkermansiaceae bacterium]|nr:thioredoxin family protein [Akkermansiaceae bacterium]NNM30062.1 thioredoxin family protein [Akkermansiaceae bacterium]